MSPPGCRLLLLLFALSVFLWVSAGPTLAATATAEPARLADRTLLLDGQVVGDRLVAVGERGHILISTDAGRSWRQSPAPTRVTLTSLFFVDDRQGWAAGHDATILRTRDGGTSWQLVHSDPELDAPILDLWFRDAEFGLAVGAYGLLLETTDGGDSWQQRPLTIDGTRGTAALVDDADTPGIDLHLNHLVATPTGQLYLAGESGHLLRSGDDGRRWAALPFPYEGSLFGTLPLAGERLLAFGLRGHLFASRDAGKSWQAIATGTETTLNDALRLRDGRIVAVGLAGTVLVGTPDATRFDLRPQADRAGFARVLETPDGALLLLGSHGARRLELQPDGDRR